MRPVGGLRVRLAPLRGHLHHVAAAARRRRGEPAAAQRRVCGGRAGCGRTALAPGAERYRRIAARRRRAARGPVSARTLRLASTLWHRRRAGRDGSRQRADALAAHRRTPPSVSAGRLRPAAARRVHGAGGSAHWRSMAAGRPTRGALRPLDVDRLLFARQHALLPLRCRRLGRRSCRTGVAGLRRRHDLVGAGLSLDDRRLAAAGRSGERAIAVGAGGADHRERQHGSDRHQAAALAARLLLRLRRHRR